MNKMILKIQALPQNELVIRTSLIAFLLPLNPTNDELLELKTICAEAVVNVIVHAYEDKEGFLEVMITYDENRNIQIVIKDEGKGIENLEEMLQANKTTKETEEHSGMGFTIMDSFSDHMTVDSSKHMGTTVVLEKRLHDYQ